MHVTRRKWIKNVGFGLFSLSCLPQSGYTITNVSAERLGSSKPLIQLSLAEWSLHRMLFKKQLSHLAFPAYAKQQFGIQAVEYVNQFFKDKANDIKYLSELKQRCDDNGVTSVLIMCDQEGMLGDSVSKNRIQSVENHYKWIEAAQFLGCHSIRVNVSGNTGTMYELASWVAESLRMLSEFGRDYGISILVENHGGYSSNGRWLRDVIQAVNLGNCGTLPDTGNFCVVREKPSPEEQKQGARFGKCTEEYDRYMGVEELLPYAKGISAKTYDFDSEGNEITIDFRRISKLIKAAGFSGHIGIEYDGLGLSEVEGIWKTKELLTKFFNL